MTELWEEFNNLSLPECAARHPALFAYVKKEMAAPEKQFLFVGDTQHSSEENHKFLFSPELAGLCRYVGIPHVAIEMRREMLPRNDLESYCRQFNALTAQERQAGEQSLLKDFKAHLREWAGGYELNIYSAHLRDWQESIENVRAQVRNGLRRPADAERLFKQWDEEYESGEQAGWARRVFGFIHAGLRVTPADSWQWWPSIVPTDGERFYLGDREVADYIGQKAQGEKTLITYGAGHMWHRGGLCDRLGREKCVYIDIHQDRDAYDQIKHYGCRADVMPDRVYLLKERALEAPDPALYQAPENLAHNQLQDWEDEVLQKYGAAVEPAAKEAAVSKIAKLPGFDPKYFTYTPSVPAGLPEI